MTLTQQATLPPQVDQATTETLPWGFDTSPLLQPGQTPSAPSATLTDLTSSTPITLADNPSTAGNIITQPVRGSVLNPGHTYRLDVTFTAVVGTVWTMSLLIVCTQ